MFLAFHENCLTMMPIFQQRMAMQKMQKEACFQAPNWWLSGWRPPSHSGPGRPATMAPRSGLDTGNGAFLGSPHPALRSQGHPEPGQGSRADPPPVLPQRGTPHRERPAARGGREPLRRGLEAWTGLWAGNVPQLGCGDEGTTVRKYNKTHWKQSNTHGSEQGALNLGTAGVWDASLLAWGPSWHWRVVGGVPSCLPLDTSRPSPPNCDNQTVSRHRHMSPVGQNHPQCTTSRADGNQVNWKGHLGGTQRRGLEQEGDPRGTPKQGLEQEEA